MLQKFIRTAETCTLAALAVTILFNAAWAGPPAPPVIAAQLPATPVGGPEISIATAVGIAAYGLWKSRR
jgi:hypothetical protein